MTHLRFFLFLFAAAFSLSACDSDGTEDTPSGTYEATLFEVEIDGETVNVLAAGGDLRIDLRNNGTAAGVIIVPDELAEDPGDTRIEFEGTYSVSGDRVDFDHEADTFVRDADWTYDDGRLETADGEITVVLTRQGLD